MSKHRNGTRSIRSLIVLKWHARRMLNANRRAAKATERYARAYVARYGGRTSVLEAQVDWVEAMLR
jgi:hypothetical protein